MDCSWLGFLFVIIVVIRKLFSTILGFTLSKITISVGKIGYVTHVDGDIVDFQKIPHTASDIKTLSLLSRALRRVSHYCDNSQIILETEYQILEQYLLDYSSFTHRLRKEINEVQANMELCDAKFTIVTKTPARATRLLDNIDEIRDLIKLQGTALAEKREEEESLGAEDIALMVFEEEEEDF